MVELENEPLLGKGSQANVTVEATEDYDTINDNEPRVKSHNLSLSERFIKFWTVPSIAAVCCCYTLISLSSMSLAVEQSILFNKACETNMVDGYCSPLDNLMLVASYQQVNDIVRKVCLVIALSFIGRLSDSYGRQPILLSICTSLLISCLILTFATYFCYGLKFKTLIFASAIGSGSGGVTALTSLLNSYLCDITDGKERKSAMSTLFAFLFVFQTVGQFIGSLMLSEGKAHGISEEKNNFIPLFGGLFCLALLTLYTAVLPESLNKENIQSIPSFDHQSFSFENIVKTIKHQCKETVGQIRLLGLPDEYIPENLKNKSKEIRYLVIFLITLLILVLISDESIAQIAIQYVIYWFKWDAQTLTNYVMVSSIACSVVLVGVFPYLNNVVFPKLGLKYLEGQLDSSDFLIISLSLFSEILGNFFVGISKSTTEIFIIPLVSCFQATLIPCVNAAITKFYPNNKVAEVLVSIQFFTNLVGLVVPPLFLEIYKASLRIGLPQIPFFMVTGINVIFFIGLWYIFFLRKGV